MKVCVEAPCLQMNWVLDMALVYISCETAPGFWRHTVALVGTRLEEGAQGQPCYYPLAILTQLKR